MMSPTRVFELSDCTPVELHGAATRYAHSDGVAVPLSHWELTLEFAKSVAPERGDFMDRASSPSREDDCVAISLDETLRFVEYSAWLINEIENTSSSLYSFEKGIFSDITNWLDDSEFPVMLEAISTVYRMAAERSCKIETYNI